MFKHASDVKQVPVKWFWKPYIPYGKVTLLCGDGETGKSWISLWMAAQWSRREDWPFGAGGAGSSAEGTRPCLVANAEDDPDDTVAPRLAQMGSDLSRVVILADEDNNAHAWELNEIGLAKLDEQIGRWRPALFVLDSINAWFGRGADMYRPNEVRAFMDGLKGIARKHDCAAVCIGHLTKGTRSRAQNSILGSVDFYNAARSALITKRKSRESCVMSQVKGSLVAESEKIQNMEYQIGPEGPIWLGETELSADDLTEAEAEGATGKGGLGDLKGAEAWLRRTLDGRALPSSELAKAGMAQGYSVRTLERARSALRVKSWKAGAQWMVGLDGPAEAAE